jgi:hypothetical protein
MPATAANQLDVVVGIIVRADVESFDGRAAIVICFVGGFAAQTDDIGRATRSRDSQERDHRESRCPPNSPDHDSFPPITSQLPRMAPVPLAGHLY